MPKICFYLLMLLLLSLCGCESERDRNRARANIAPAIITSPIVVSGRVVKGVVSGAVVTALNPSDLKVIATGVTDSEGYYSMVVPAEFYGLPLKMEAVANIGSSMLCDVTRGCLGSPYGGVVVLQDSQQFILKALVPEVTNEAPVNITILTSIAERLERTQSNVNKKVSYLNANAIIAREFGLAGRLESIGSLNVLSDEISNSIDSVSIRNSLINSVLLDAVMSNSVGGDFISAIEVAISSVAGYASNGQKYVSVIQKQNVYETLLQYSFTHSLNSSGITRVLGLIESELSFADIKGGGSLAWELSRPIEINLAPTAQVKKFVQKVRQIRNFVDFGSLLSLSSLDSLTADGILKITEVFGLNLAEKQQLTSSLPDYVQGLSRVMSAILVVIAEHNSGSEIPSEVNGIRISVEILDDKYVFQVDQNIDICEEDSTTCKLETDLQVTVNVDLLGGSSATDTLVFGGGIRVTGFLSNGVYSASFLNSSEIDLQRILVQFKYSDPEKTEMESLSFSGQDIKAYFPVTLASVSPELEPSAFNADVSLSFVLLDFNYSSVMSLVSGGSPPLFSSEQVFNLNRVHSADTGIALSDAEVSGHKNIFVANVKQAEGLFSSGLQFKTNEIFNCENGVFVAESCEKIFSEKQLAGETSEEYLKLALTLYGTSSIYGKDGTATLAIGGERISDVQNAINSLNVEGLGRLIALKGTFNSIGGITSLSGSNTEGVSVDIATEGGGRVGYVRDYSGAEFADMLDMGEWLKFTYSDGTFDSL